MKDLEIMVFTVPTRWEAGEILRKICSWLLTAEEWGEKTRFNMVDDM